MDSLLWRSFLKLWHQGRGIFSQVTALRAHVVVLIHVSLQGRAMILPNPRSLLRYSLISRARKLSLIEPHQYVYWLFSHPSLFQDDIFFLPLTTFYGYIKLGMATPSSILAWKIPLTEEHGGLQSMKSQRVRHDWVTNTTTTTMVTLN